MSKSLLTIAGTNDATVAATSATPIVPCIGSTIGIPFVAVTAGGVEIVNASPISDFLPVSLNAIPTVPFNYLYNGPTNDSWDRMRSVSLDTTAPSGQKVGVQSSEKSGHWAIAHEPAVNVQATITRALAAETRHVCTGIFATLNAVVAIAAPLSLYLRDGASGAGAILWSGRFILPIGQTAIISVPDLSIAGSPGVAMTLEWSAAPGAANFENVSLTGFTTI